jgi:hypothetical protein
MLVIKTDAVKQITNLVRLFQFIFRWNNAIVDSSPNSPHEHIKFKQVSLHLTTHISCIDRTMNLRFLSVFTAIAAILQMSLLCQARDWFYHDNTCEERVAWGDDWDLMIDFVIYSINRLQSATDHDFHNVVKWIFKVNDRSEDEDRWQYIEGVSTIFYLCRSRVRY